MARMLLLLFVAFTLSACKGGGDTEDQPIDADGDGWEEHVDCDDNDDKVHPEATEICDEVDNDCDGDIDEGGTTTFFEDADLDGYGNPDATVEACTTGEGVVNNSVDCDDANPDTNPYAPEICDYQDNDCDTLIDENATTTFWLDEDGDGYGDPDEDVQDCDEDEDGVVDSNEEGIVSNDEDCDDSDADVNPDASEYCDEIDNDCDGLIDEDDALDARSWYRDSDGDGYGDAASVRLACEQPIGYADNEFDCDDTAPNAYPGATEYCDDLDNDCDGVEDEDDAVDAPTWYEDDDGDGWGDDSSTVVQCEVPSSGSWATVGDDCADTDAEVNPDADEECDDSIDNDCDGLTDDGSAVDADVLWLDYDGDGFGNASSTLSSCTPVSGYVDNDDDCDDTDADVNPDADERCDDGVDNDCDGHTDDSNAIDAVTYYLDADTDGYGDSSSPQGVCETNVPSGYVDDATDCDDTDASIYPGATEYCDSVDEDCDGTVDNDPADGDTYYLDSDGDGYGVSTTTTISCTEPSGYADNSRDCDDTDADINPDTVWYYDADRDGYGDASGTYYVQCLNPWGSGSAYGTIVTGDCDNYDATTYPGADEVCVAGCAAEGDDNDCDGTIDEGCPEIHGSTISADETWDATADHYVACDVYVQASAGPVLTIEDGTVVYFANGTGIYVGHSNYGDIDIQGTSLGVSFESAPTAVGSYDGLIINYYATGSSIEGLTLEGGGYNASYPGSLYIYNGDVEVIDSVFDGSDRYGIYINNADPLITGTTVQNAASTGIYCASTNCLDSDEASFVDNTLSGNGGYPISMYAPTMMSMDASSTFAGNTTDLVHVYSGTVSESTTWQNLDVPWFIAGTVYIQGGAPHPTVTIEDGSELQFDTDGALRVGYSNYGDLVVDGHTSGVTMTSWEDPTDRDQGDWYGVSYQYYTSASSSIDGLTLEYAGGNSSYVGGLYLYNPDSMDITDSTFQYNENYGVYVANGGGATFDTCIFQNNEKTGLYIVDGGRLEGDLMDSVLTGNGEYPISVPSYYLDNLDTSTTFSGNTDDYIRVTHHSHIDYDAVWHAHDVPYQVVETIYIMDSSGPVVTIEDDSQWYFNSGISLHVGYSSYGDLVVDGDSSDGTSVLFSAYHASLPGTWNGIHYNYYTTGLSSMSGFDLEYAGANSSYQGGLYLYYTDIAISDCSITDNERWGIYGAGYVELELTDCTISGTEATSLSSNGDGVHLTSTDAITTWSGNTLTSNERYPVSLYANELAMLDDASSYSGNGTGYDYVLSYGGTVVESGTWEDLDVPYLFDGNTTIQRTSSTTTSPTVAVYDAEIYMGLGHYIQVGSGNYGDFIADNTVFTSQRDISGSTPSTGDWGGIWVGWYASSVTSITDNEIHWGGGNSSYQGNIYLHLNYTSPTITGNDIAYSRRYGIYCTSSTYCQYATISSNTASGTNTLGNTNGYCPGF